jgi:hypothetical protein
MSLNVEQQVKGFVATLGYVGILTERQYQDQNIYQTAPGDPSTAGGPSPQGAPGRLDTTPYYAEFPGVNEDIQLLMSTGGSNYNALQASLERRYGKNLALSANYTLAHALNDTMSMDGRSLPEGWGNVPVNAPWRSIPAEVHNIEYGNSDFDVRHRIAANANYQIPLGNSLRGAAGELAKGWALNGIFVFMTGEPFSVVTGVNGGQEGTNTSPPNNQDRPNQVGDWHLAHRTTAEWFNTSAFVLQPAGTAGNERRNQLSGPVFRHFDLSLGKQFAITEGKSLQFRAESFNLTNTTNFDVPVNGFAPNFGTIGNTRFSPRQIQFALKLLF